MVSFRRVPNRFAAPEPRQADILRVEHGELAPGLPVVEIVVQYEKYFYDKLSLAKESEKDKSVMELMVRF